MISLLPMKGILLQNYLDIAGVMFVALGATGEITVINKKGCSVLGYEEGELLGKNWFDKCLPSSIREEVKQTFQRLMAGEGESVEYYQNPVLTKTGEERLIAWHNAVLTDEDGNNVGTLSSGEDITDRKLAEAALQESQRSLTTLLSNLPGMAYRCRNDKNWTMEFVSEGCLDLTGYHPSELTGNRRLAFNKLIAVDHEKNVWDEVQAALRERTPFQLEYQITAKSGQEKWVWEQGQGVFSSDDELTGIEGFITDISGRVKAENALQESMARIRAIVETAVDGIITIDERGIMESFNQSAERMFGYKAQEMIGENVRRLMPSPYRDEHNHYISNYLNTGERKIIGFGREVVGLRKDGSTFPLYLAVSEIDLGERRVFTGIVRDLTQQKAMQEQILQSERLAVIGKMAAKVAHEIRNPLSSVSLNAELLEDEIQELGSHNDEAKSLLKSMIQEIDRVTALTDEYLQFSRLPESNPMKGQFSDLLGDVREFIDSELAQKRIEFEFEDTNPTFSVRLDPTQFRRVLMNLIRNAIESMPQGGKLRIWTEKDGKMGILNIQDNGTGIPKEKLEKIFEPFFTTKDFGTGLGLAITQQIVREHGGRISCKSQIGRGTRFRIELPLTK
ncbi:PAS domain S-box protein [bacterium]|nr:PAS domain S-box protein [bacterium]